MWLLQDGEVWKRVATMSTELGYLRQAIYCLSAVSLYPCKADTIVCIVTTPPLHSVARQSTSCSAGHQP